MAKVSLRIYNREIENLIEQGQLDEAGAHCLHVLKTYPKHLDTYRLLGKAYLEGKRYAEAADIFQRVLASVPDDFVSHVGLSIIHDDGNRPAEAVWHMERAFDVQPSNAAVQGELQRLLARRDGQSPAKIRMSRGALAHMYVQGELYPQAIGEIRAVLKDDPTRADMQVLLARAHFRAGQKVEASEACSALLKRFPFCLDANRILTEILPGTGRAENTQVYRHRVNALDPYAAFTSSSVFDSASVPDAAVSLERLTWSPGQPPALGSGWAGRMGIALDSGPSEPAQPDWMRVAEEPAGARPAPDPGPASSLAAPSAAPAGESEEDIPEFLRQAGWKPATGEAVEGPMDLGAEATGQPLASAEMPDWIRAMRPAEADAPAAAPTPAEELPDWLRTLGSEPPAAASTAAAGDRPNWLGELGEEKPAPSAPAASASADLSDWLSGLSATEGGSGKAPTPEPKAPMPEKKPVISTPPPAPATPGSIGDLGTRPEEQDAAMAWLESLASKQGAKSEELITRPEDRTEAAPDWVARARTAAGETPAPAPSAPAPTPPEPVDDTPAWLRDLKSAETPAAPGSDRTGSWMRGLEEGPAAPAASAAGSVTDFLRNLDAAPEPVAAAPAAGEDLPDWLREIESARPAAVAAAREDLPEWLRDEAEAKPKPTEPEEWKPAVVAPPPAAAPVRQPEPEPVRQTVTRVAPEPEPEPLRQTVVRLTPEPAPAAAAPAAKHRPRPAKSTRSAGPAVPDQVIFTSAQDFLKRGDVASALAEYGKLVKRSHMLDETIYDLREALYRFPVEVTLWQMLGDAYMRANRLQDALDAYTKAEELLR